MNARQITINGSSVRWVVNLRDEDGRRKRKYFRSRKEAEKHIRQLMRGDQSDQWWSALRPEKKRAVYAAYEKAVDLNSDLLKIVCLFEEDSQSSSVLIKDALKSFIEAKKEKGLRIRSLENLESKIGMFSAVHGNNYVHRITPEEIKDWMKGKDWSPLTRKVNITVLIGFFNWCIEKGMASDNPCKKLEKPLIDHKEVQVFSVSEVREILKTAIENDSGLTPYFAIGIFAGLRPNSELSHMDWSNVKDDVIEVNSFKVRSARRRFVTIQPNLRQWLNIGGELPVERLKTRRDNIIKASGVKWISDGMRHSFGSYHLANFHDSGKTSAEMGHSKPETLFNHYRERISSQAAMEFWSIVPSDPFFSPV